MPKTAVKEVSRVQRSGISTSLVTRCEEALEAISLGISEIEECGIEQLTSNAYIDVIARLNAQSNGLTKLVEPHKARIKSRILQDNQGSNQDKFIDRGDKYQAVVCRISKRVLVMDKVKKFLGTKLAQFQETRDEVQLSFQVKE